MVSNGCVVMVPPMLAISMMVRSSPPPLSQRPRCQFETSSRTVAGLEKQVVAVAARAFFCLREYLFYGPRKPPLTPGMRPVPERTEEI